MYFDTFFFIKLLAYMYSDVSVLIWFEFGSVRLGSVVFGPIQVSVLFSSAESDSVDLALNPVANAIGFGSI